jgi:hypothetical protein
MLIKVFSWNEGSYHFREEAPPESEDATPGLSTGEMILEAVRRITDPDVVRYALGDIDQVVRLSGDPSLASEKLDLGPAERDLLSRTDGARTARELVETGPSHAPEMHRSLLGLLCTGTLEYVPCIPAAAR